MRSRSLAAADAGEVAADEPAAAPVGDGGRDEAIRTQARARAAGARVEDRDRGSTPASCGGRDRLAGSGAHDGEHDGYAEECARAIPA